MQKPYTPATLLLTLLLLILFYPTADVHATGLSFDATEAAGSSLGPLPGRPQTGYRYTIQPGDTLWDIAAAHDITLDVLLAVNPLIDPEGLLPGDTILVPATPVVVPRKTLIVSASATTAERVAQAATTSITIPTSLPPEIADWPAVILAFINEQRAAVGVAPLTWSEELAAAAQAHADDCRQRGWGSHEGSDGARLKTRLARAGFDARWSGENWANALNPQHALEMWWNEPPGADPHRSNILNPMYLEIGIGITSASWGYYFFTDFGTRQQR